MSVLTVSDLTVRFGERVALRDVSLEIDAGELVAVIGPNGAGKSSLFRAICGLVAHSGHVCLDGQHCHHRRDRLAVAYLPQHSDLDVDFPVVVGEVVLAGRRRFRRFGRRPTAADRTAASDALDRVGLPGFERRPLRTLSGGQVQRVLLARALAQEADVLLLDEAFSGVDQPSTEALLALFAELRSEGRTIVVATHDLALARRRFGRCLAINGRLVADGPPRAALAEGPLEATFGSAGSAA